MDRFPNKVDLKHRALTPEEQGYVKKALRKGWFCAKGEPKARQRQMSAWELVCYDNRADYVCFEEREDGVWLDVHKFSRVPLSRIFFEEEKELLKRWKLKSLERIRLREGLNLEKLAEDILALYARDRTVERTAELQRTAHEGMAEAVDGTRYWDDVKPGQHAHAYIIPIAGKPGRCVVLRHQHLPLVDVPLEHFRLLDENS